MGPESLSEEPYLFTSEEPRARGIMMEKQDLSIELHSEGHPKITPITQNWWEMSRSGDSMIGRSLERKVTGVY